MILRHYIFPIAFILSVVTALAIFHQPVPAQSAQTTPPATPGDKVWRSYLQPEDIIHLAVQGDDIWAATKYSVIHWNRLNGQYTQYTSIEGLPESEIISFTPDPSGGLWVMTLYEGIGLLDDQKWLTSTVRASNLIFEAKTPSSNSGVWAFEGKTISYYSGQPLPELRFTQTITAGAPDKSLTLLALDLTGQPWAAGQGVVSYFDGQGWVTYTVEDGLPEQPITTLVFDPTGRAWIGTAGGGLGYLGPEDTTWTVYTVEDGLASNWITAIAFDTAGQPWAGTLDHGVSHLEENEGEQAPFWTTYTVADGLASQTIHAILFDPAGQPWVVTRNNGLSAFDGQSWTTYPYPGDLAFGWVTATTFDDSGHLWLGQANGQVSQLAWDEQTGGYTPHWTVYQTTGPADNRIQAAAIDGAGRKWLGTAGGVSVFDGQSWTTYTTGAGLIDNNVTAVAVDKADQLWFGTPKGLSHFDGQSWTNYPLAGFNPQNYNQVEAIAVDSAGHRWFGTSNGLLRFDGQSWLTYTVEAGLAGNRVRAIAVDDAGDLWLGTSGGANHLILDEGGSPAWTTYTVEDGLVDNDINALVIDQAGNKWFGASSGLSRFDGQTWTTYTVEDGLASNQVHTLAIDRDGHLWVGAEFGGLSEFDGQNWLIHSQDLGVSTITSDPAGPIWFGTGIDGLKALVDASPAAGLTSAWEPVTFTPPAASRLTETPTALPPPANHPAAAPPAQPLQAWSLAPDGAVFVLDAAGSLYQLDPTGLAPLAQSSSLFPAETEHTAYLLAGATQLFVGSTATTQTLILDRATFAEIARLDQAGSMALDPGRQLLMLPEEAVMPDYSGELWRYDLADLTQPPQRIRIPCPSGPLTADPAHRRLVIQITNCGSSPPHRRDFYQIYELDTLTLLGETEARDPGGLAQPAIAGQAGLMATVYSALSGLDQVVLFDLQGQELRAGDWKVGSGAFLAIDPKGEWLYLAHARGLDVRRLSDLSLQSLLPLTTTRPAGLALAPDAETLYLFGGGQLTAFPTVNLHQAGIQPATPWPAAWAQEQQFSGDIQPLYLFPSPTFEQDGFAFVELLAPFERYRTSDQGASWLFLPPPSGPAGLRASFLPLSLSPGFSHDRTLVMPGLRSTDAGETWADWSPPIAFTSDRDGNREIYTMDETGEALQRLTNNPAADENPAWSPAWTWLAFQSDRNGNWDIFNRPADCPGACEAQQLTTDPAADMLPAWSPDGRWIAFVSTRDGNPEIYVMDQDGQNQRRLTFNESGDWRPAWLRDSQHLIFTSDRSGSNDIYQLTVPPAGSPPPTAEPDLVHLVTGPSDDRDPAVDIDGRILFLSDREGKMRTHTYTAYSDPNPERIAAYSTEDRLEGHPSPLNRETILISMEENGETGIYRVRSYSEPILLTSSEGSFNGQPAAGPVWWLPDPEASREWLATHP